MRAGFYLMNDNLFFNQIVFVLLDQWLKIIIGERSVSIIDLEGTIAARDFLSCMTCVSRIDKLDWGRKRLVVGKSCFKFFERILLFRYLQRVLEELTI